MKRLPIFFFTTIIIIACSAKGFVPTDQQLVEMRQKVPGITMESAKAGFKLYSQKCAGCHQLYLPGKYTIARWNNILPKMFPKAKMTSEEQQKLVRDYLQALSK